MSCSKQGELKRGAWSEEEDEILTNFVNLHGHGKWRRIAQNAGLKRCGKSCRLRWLNYLRPDIKRGDLTVDEEDLIIRLHRLLGNRWALIAGRLPGRTDNEIKNYWNTKLMKKHNKATQFSSSTTMKFEDQDGHKTQEDTHRMVNNQERQEFETSKAIPNADELTDGMIFFPTSGNNVDFLADIDEIGCGFSGGFVVPDLENVVGSWAQGSWEDDAKLLDVEMMDYSGDGDPILLDIDLKKLASLLDLDQED